MVNCNKLQLIVGDTDDTLANVRGSDIMTKQNIPKKKVTARRPIYYLNHSFRV